MLDAVMKSCQPCGASPVLKPWAKRRDVFREVHQDAEESAADHHAAAWLPPNDEANDQRPDQEVCYARSGLQAC